MMRKIIAIDGPAAGGKGTLSRNLAQKLNFAHMDTGALYRAVAFEVSRAKDDPQNEAAAVKACKMLQEKLKNDGADQVLGNVALRQDDIAQMASVVASVQAVRDCLVDIQRDFARNPPAGFGGAILDGRDIGTVICPQAHLKLYIEAKTEIRAQRRLKELQSKGLSVTYDAVLADMRARDERDTGRKAAPLRPAEDAIVIDSSTLSEGQMLELALEYAIKAFAS